MKKRATLCLLMFLAACGTSEEPDYYTLTPVEGTPVADVAAVIKVQRPSLAGYLDRPEFIQEIGDSRIAVNGHSEWAEPLDKMFARIFADDLQQRLPAGHVLAENDTVTAEPRYIISFDIEHFNRVENGSVRCEGKIIITDKTSTAEPQFVPFGLTANAGYSPAAITDSLSKLVGQVADIVAAQGLEK